MFWWSYSNVKDLNFLSILDSFFLNPLALDHYLIILYTVIKIMIEI